MFFPVKMECLLIALHSMIIVSKKLVRLITFNFASAIALYPFILLSDKCLLEDRHTIFHEKIHLRQQIELLIVSFYMIYVLEYMFYRIKGMNHYDAYMNISFEKEAYANEKNSNYLNEKSFFSFISYL
jgi:hypothetical protein